MLKDECKNTQTHKQQATKTSATTPTQTTAQCKAAYTRTNTYTHNYEKSKKETDCRTIIIKSCYRSQVQISNEATMRK